ncbi:MAG: HDIG domain-containing metalloprotein [Anaerolineales bacterium]|jgi:putative nucleotidyltransferase with HDIG domain
MNGSRLFYRSRQFWQAISTRSVQQDGDLIGSILSEPQVELFRRMQKSEQAHSRMVLSQLRNQGEQDPDLLTAALLHDVGKTRMPLRIWERVLVVLVKATCPGCVQRWGAGDDGNQVKGFRWKRAFVVAEQHPVWGAEMAAECGTSRLAVRLIARHQEQLPLNPHSGEDILLQKLQSVDDMN